MWIDYLLIGLTVATLLLTVVIGRRRNRFFKRCFPVDLTCVVAGVCLLAYVGVTSRRTTVETTVRRLYVFVIDCSRSMLADDNGETRLQNAKDIANKLVADIKDGQLAIVSFAGTAFLDLPPTEDREAFRDALAQLAPSLEDLPGSDPAAALKFAETVAKLASNSSATAILLSDGEIQGGTDEYWKDRSIPLVWRCVGVGAPQPIPLGQVWMHDPDTGETALTQASPEKINLCAALSSAPFSHTLEIMERTSDGTRSSHIGFFCVVAALLLLLALRTPTPRMLLLLLAVSWGVQASPLDESPEGKRKHAEAIRSELAELPLKSPRRAVLLANWAVLIAEESLDDAILLTQEALRLAPTSKPIKRNLDILKARRQPKPSQDEPPVKQEEVAGLDELLSLPSERQSEEKPVTVDAQAVTVPSAPGTWREIQHRNRHIRARMVKAKPW